MKDLKLLVIIILTCIGCTNPSEEKISEEKTQQFPHDFMFMQRAYPSGELKTEAYREAIQWKKQLATRSSSVIDWEFIGPVNIGGRITDIEIPIDNADTYYVGAASGGIFKTTDGGANWVPVFDEQEMLSIGDIEISKNDTDIVWVGTGEVNAGGGSLAYDGDGIYRSEDGGTTWESRGLPNVGSIGKLVIDPNNDDIVFVGAMGPLFKNNSNRGVYRTTNGGATWEQKLFINDSTGVIDMVIHPTNGNIVYAASWERVRRPNYRSYGGMGSRIYRSVDGGENWSVVLPGVPTEIGRISLAISQSNPNVLYTRLTDPSGNISGVYRTSDGGDNWQAKNFAQLTNVGFHWWFRGIYVDPLDENTIYNVDFEVQKSINGGDSWSPAFPGVHVDQHALAFNTMLPGEVLLGNDGGLYYSNDDGATSSKDLTLPITQFYRMHVDASNNNKIYGGAQDNSTSRTTTGSLNDWDIINGGDGFQPLVDPNDTNVIYALSQNGALRKSTNNGASFSNALNGINAGDRNNWDTPITFDPNDSQTLYYGTQRVFRTANAAGIWEPISPDLSDGPHSGNLTFGTITTIDVSRENSAVIYAGTDEGNVWVTQNGGSNWTNISATLPDRWVTKVLADPTNASGVYATFSGYRFGEDDGHVFYSSDFGATWIDISTNLPDIPVNDVEVTAQEGIVLGTDIGVLRTNSPGDNWEVFGEGLPNVVVTDLDYKYGDPFVYAATYGRSAYRIQVGVLEVEDFNNPEFVLYPNPVSEELSIKLSLISDQFYHTVFDLNGRAILNGEINEFESTISVRSLVNGIYFIKIENDEQQLTKKFIKR